MLSSGWPCDLPARIDHTLLRPDATTQDVLRLCSEAQRYGFAVVFVSPCYLDEARAALAGSSIRLGTPVGFPFGSQRTSTKVQEAVEAVDRGARELDMVLNISRMKSGDYDQVQADIQAVVNATPEASHKVILETCYLTEEEKRLACRLAIDAGADYAKTSTGFGSAGATVEDVRLMVNEVAGRISVKAAGGIRDLQLTRALLEAGADRIGTSAGVAIIEEWLAERWKREEGEVRLP